MKIGIDIDETLLNYIPILCDWHNHVYHTSLTKPKITSYNLWEVWGGTKEEAIQKVHSFQESDYFDMIGPVEGAVRGIRKLHLNNEIYILTSRSDYFSEKTKEQLLNYFGDKFLDIFFTNNYSNSTQLVSEKKSDICLDVGIELMIDDNFETAVQCADSWIRVLMMSQPWNKGKSYPGVQRVNNWKEILEKI